MQIALGSRFLQKWVSSRESRTQGLIKAGPTSAPQFCVSPVPSGRSAEVSVDSFPLVKLAFLFTGTLIPRTHSLTTFLAAFLQLSQLAKQKSLPHNTLKMKRSRERLHNWLKVTPLASNEADI